MTAEIKPDRVRYIKLGKEGGWEAECVQQSIVRIGFGSATSERFALCANRHWGELTQSFIAGGKDKGTATRFANEMRLFFDDKGTTLWITFAGHRLCWGFLDPTPAEQHPDGDGVFRRVKDGWRWTDRNGGALTKDCLSGSLTKLASYRGTTCGVGVADYVVRRINGLKTPEVERAVMALNALNKAVQGMMTLLGPKDFELLVDLVFTNSGWRRLGVVGKTEKTLDLDLVLPSTGERAFVQVKSTTDSKELGGYVAKLEDLDIYKRMFFVHHSGQAKTDNEKVVVIGPEKLAEMVVDAGLAGWLLNKVS